MTNTSLFPESPGLSNHSTHKTSRTAKFNRLSEETLRSEQVSEPQARRTRWVFEKRLQESRTEEGGEKRSHSPRRAEHSVPGAGCAPRSPASTACCHPSRSSCSPPTGHPHLRQTEYTCGEHREGSVGSEGFPAQPRHQLASRESADPDTSTPSSALRLVNQQLHTNSLISPFPKLWLARFLMEWLTHSHRATCCQR